MICGAIGLNHAVGPVVFQNIGPGRGNGVTAQRYINQVLLPSVVPFFQQHRHFTLQLDNDRPHTARLTANFLQQHNIRVMPWPLLSPDLNPIEHFWDALQRQINRIQPRPTAAAELEQVIRQAWPYIGMAAISRLIYSMPTRCQAVIDACRGHTRF